MKLILIIIAAICVSSNGLEISEELLEHARTAIADGITKAFLDRLEYGVYAHDGRDAVAGPKMSLLPDFEDPAFLKSTLVNLDFDLFGIIKSSGNLSMVTPKVTGLSKVEDDLEFGTAGGLYVQWTLNVPTVLMTEAEYELSWLMNSDVFTGFPGNNLKLTGNGQFLGNVSDVYFQLRLNASGIMDKLVINDLWFDFGFKNLAGHAENTAVNGNATSFDEIADVIQTAFDTVWNEKSKYQINARVWCSINHAVRDCNAMELINLIHWCLDKTPNPECETATNPPTVPTTPYVSPDPTASTSRPPTDPSASTSIPTDPTASTPDTSDGTSIHNSALVTIIAALGIYAHYGV